MTASTLLRRTGAVLLRVLPLLALAAACGPSSEGTISGKVVFTDMSDAQRLNVTLLGPTGKRIETGPGGTYSFEKLLDGVYLVTVDAPDTKEGRQSFGTEVKGKVTVTAPDLTFTPVGVLKGKVQNASGPVAGANVSVSGLDRTALTDSAGAFSFLEMPAGAYTVIARLDGQVPQTATAMATVKRGTTGEQVTLQLEDDKSAQGTLEGTVLLANGENPMGVKLTAAVGYSVNADPKGKFSLKLPPGEFEVIAEAAGYPKQSLGRYTVRAGETTTVPLQAMSLFSRWEVPYRVSSANIVSTSEGDNVVMRVSVNADYNFEFYVVNRKTGDRKLFWLGGDVSPVLGKAGRVVLMRPFAQVLAYDTVSGNTRSFALGDNSAQVALASDESAVMIYQPALNQLTVWDLSNGNQKNIAAFNGFFMSNDRFIVRQTNAAGAFEISSVNPAGNVTSVASNINAFEPLIPYGMPQFGGFNVNPSAVLFTAQCAAMCSFQVMTLTAGMPSAVAVGVVPPGYQTVPVQGSVKEYITLRHSTTTAPVLVLVKTDDGTVKTLPTTTANNIQRIYFNEPATRLVIESINNTPIPALREWREEPVASVTALSSPFTTHNSAISTANQIFGWISPTRFMFFETNGAVMNPAVKRIDIKNGVVSPVDADVIVPPSNSSATRAIVFAGPAVAWVKASDGKRQGAVYDSGILPSASGFDNDVTNLSPWSGLAGRTDLNNPFAPMSKYAVMRDGALVMVFDGQNNEVRKVQVGTLNGGGIGADRYWFQKQNSGFVTQSYMGGRVFSLSEPSVSLSAPAMLPKGGMVVAGVETAIDPRAIHFGNF